MDFFGKSAKRFGDFRDVNFVIGRWSDRPNIIFHSDCKGVNSKPLRAFTSIKRFITLGISMQGIYVLRAYN